ELGSIGREDRIAQHSAPADEPMRLAPLAAHRPDLAPVNKRDLRLAQCGRLQEQWLTCVTECKSAKLQHQQSNEREPIHDDSLCASPMFEQSPDSPLRIVASEHNEL